jgi:predicted 3-demethylubiquinone-9 3-methyltransferase (glyoxalase superfamily)
LWFDDNAEEAVNFYTSIFENAKIRNMTRYDEVGAKASGRPNGSVMTASFNINGHEFVALNGGPAFRFNSSISFFLNFDPSKEKNARKILTSCGKSYRREGPH